MTSNIGVPGYNANCKVQQQLQLDAEDILQLRNIYATSFPASQQIEFGLLLATIENGARALHTIKVENRLSGFAITLSLPQTTVYLLEYLAVQGELRGRGLGTKLLQSVLQDHCKTQHAAGIILEVESEVDVTGEEKKQRLRRIRFYERNGAMVVDCAPSYRCPNKMWQNGMPMRLMWIPLNTIENSISSQLLRTCIIGIFTESYYFHPDDPLLKEVLAEVAC